jgi:hypothetical protein
MMRFAVCVTRLGGKPGAAEAGRLRDAGDGGAGHAGRHDEIGGRQGTGTGRQMMMVLCYGDSYAVPLCDFSSHFLFFGFE